MALIRSSMESGDRGTSCIDMDERSCLPLAAAADSWTLSLLLRRGSLYSLPPPNCSDVQLRIELLDGDGVNCCK